MLCKNRRPTPQLSPETQSKWVLTNPSPILHPLPNARRLTWWALRIIILFSTITVCAPPPAQMPQGISHNIFIKQIFSCLILWSWASQVVLVVKNLPANAGDLRDMCLTLELGRSPGGRHGNSLQYSCLQSPMDRRAWWATVQKVTRCQTWLKQLSAHTHPDTSWFPGDWPSTEIKYPSPDSKPLKSQCALQPLSIPMVPYNHSCLVMYTLMMMWWYVNTLWKISDMSWAKEMN